MNVSILGDRILIKKIENENKTAGGLVLMGSDDANTPKGVVLKVGEGKTTKTGVVVPVAVKVNDTVMYYPNTGLSVKIDGQDLLVLREEDIYAVVD